MRSTGLWLTTPDQGGMGTWHMAKTAADGPLLNGEPAYQEKIGKENVSRIDVQLFRTYKHNTLQPQ